MDTMTESALKVKVESGRKISCCIKESKLHQQHASVTLYQLSTLYPHPKFCACLIFFPNFIQLFVCVLQT